jgi:hypothetical protein
MAFTETDARRVAKIINSLPDGDREVMKRFVEALVMDRDAYRGALESGADGNANQLRV